jgi:hypothetical protein
VKTQYCFVPTVVARIRTLDQSSREQTKKEMLLRRESSQTTTVDQLLPSKYISDPNNYICS